MTRVLDKRRNIPPKAAIALSVIAVAILLWAYAVTFGVLARKWDADPQYSHGFLVPLFSLALLWLRKDKLQVSELNPSLWGFPVLLGGLALRHIASTFYLEWFEQLSIIVCVPGIVLLIGGWAALRWAWPACLFLIFMIPFPHTLEVALRDPLRRMGTLASTYVMQTVGLPAFAEGTVIVVDEVKIGVVEACSGLRMLMIFFALSTAVAMLGDRPLWQRVVIVLSAIPIALFSNVVRITTTGILHAIGYSKFADLVFHDLAGWLMMPLALLLLWLETTLMDRLIYTETEHAPLGTGLYGAGGRASSKPDSTSNRRGQPPLVTQ